MNIIGDIAGNFKTLMALLAKMPQGEEVISVGDMIDRGPRSKEVLEWFMKNGRAIMGNHEHFLLNEVLQLGYYEQGIWQYNGGVATLKNFENKEGFADIPAEIVEWIKNLPLYIEADNLLISHAPKHPFLSMEKCCDLGKGFARGSYDLHAEDTFLWNRGSPKALKGKFQVFGHNSHVGLKWFGKQGLEFAVCIDSSASKKLTGIHWPSMQIYQQDYID